MSWTDADGNISSGKSFEGPWRTLFFKNTVADDMKFETLDRTLEYIAANPMAFIYSTFSTAAANWTQGTSNPKAGTIDDWGKLWGNQSNAAVGEKTMYDPCPAGYMVPSTEQFRFVTSDNSNIGKGDDLKAAPWKANCAELIYDASGANVGHFKDFASTTPFLNDPFGLHFYIHGTKRPLAEGDEGYDPDAYNTGKAPEDTTVAYFPAQGWIGWGDWPTGVIDSYDGAQIMVQSNSPSSTGNYGGRINRMLVTHDGRVSYSSIDGAWSERSGTGAAVRCVKIE